MVSTYFSHAIMIFDPHEIVQNGLLVRYKFLALVKLATIMICSKSYTISPYHITTFFNLKIVLHFPSVQVL